MARSIASQLLFERGSLLQYCQSGLPRRMIGTDGWREPRAERDKRDVERPKAVPLEIKAGGGKEKARNLAP